MISRAEHSCTLPGCEGSIWRNQHVWDRTTAISGRDEDVCDGLAVTVTVAYDADTDSRPRILLHLGSDSDRADIDVDVSPTAAQARLIAINLLKTADMLDQWQRQQA